MNVCFLGGVRIEMTFTFMVSWSSCFLQTKDVTSFNNPPLDPYYENHHFFIIPIAILINLGFGFEVIVFLLKFQHHLWNFLSFNPRVQFRCRVWGHHFYPLNFQHHLWNFLSSNPRIQFRFRVWDHCLPFELSTSPSNLFFFQP